MVRITGSSDDLIEIDGSIREEFYSLSDNEQQYLAFSDGTLLSVEYDKDGLWRFKPVFRGSAKYQKEEGSVEDDTNDIVILDGEIKWVVLGMNFGK